MWRSLLLKHDLGKLDVLNANLPEHLDYHLEKSIFWILDLVEDVHGSLVELSLVNLLANPEFDLDFLTELLTVWLHQIEVGDALGEDGIFEHLDWDGDGELLVTLNWEINWNDNLFQAGHGFIA